MYRYDITYRIIRFMELLNFLQTRDKPSYKMTICHIARSDFDKARFTK